MKLTWKLAISGIKNNRRIYIPYILSCIGMIMMTYIMNSLSYSPLLQAIKGGTDIQFVLSLGKFVISAFALLFLFYTNSFLVRRRNKEFGLYNVLGMDRRKISRVVACESVVITVSSLVLGVTLGIVFSKFAELGLLNAMHQEVDYRIMISTDAIWQTTIIYLIIFALLLVKSVIFVWRTKTTDLLQSESFGEKPPKANWVLAVFGTLILGAAYYLAVSIKEPILALVTFFVAVIMVIIATYMLFTAGSVTICKLLQKNKSYYYKKNHFISVSSMVYRMKRNGAGLASICILATMVLVMISSTTSLFIGEEDALNTRFPKECEISVNIHDISDLSDEKVSEIRNKYETCFEERGLQAKDVWDCRYISIAGILSEKGFEPDKDHLNSGIGASLGNLHIIHFMSDDDYNAVMGTDISLDPGRSMIFTDRCEYSADTLTISDVKLELTGRLDNIPELGDVSLMSMISPTVFLVIDDYETIRPLTELADSNGNQMAGMKWYYGYDIDASKDEIVELFSNQTDCIGDTFVGEQEDGYSYYSSCRALERDRFYITFGGLFFLGIVLSIVFVFAAALIIYYKQISEGYEDQSRFAIMQKVGMTKEEIKKSINSQVMTVFFAPLLFAGMHLSFAFPFIWKILQLFNLFNLKLVILVTVAAFLIYGILYAIIYKLTAHSYYNIVSGLKD